MSLNEINLVLILLQVIQINWIFLVYYFSSTLHNYFAKCEMVVAKHNHSKTMELFWPQWDQRLAQLFSSQYTKAKVDTDNLRLKLYNAS